MDKFCTLIELKVDKGSLVDILRSMPMEYNRIKSAIHSKVGFELQGVCLCHNLHLEGVNFSNDNLSNSTFRSSILIGANFQGANLENANFQNAELEKANFQGANLKGANFRNANLKNVNFKGVKLECVNFENAKW